MECEFTTLNVALVAMNTEFGHKFRCNYNEQAHPGKDSEKEEAQALEK